MLLLAINVTNIFSQKTKIVQPKTAPDNRTPIQKLSSFFYNLEYLCSRYEDNNLKQMLADNLKNDKAFLKEREFGLNNPRHKYGWQYAP